MCFVLQPYHNIQVFQTPPVVGSPSDARASDALIVQNDEPREALALLATLVDSTNFVVLYSKSDDHHDITIVVVIDEEAKFILHDTHLDGWQPQYNTYENLTQLAP